MKANIYTVHAFAVVRVRVPDLVAHNHAEAIESAERSLDFAGLFNDDRDGIEWTGDVTHYQVDEDDDLNPVQSYAYGPDGRTPLIDGQVSVRIVIEMNGGLIQEMQAERPGVQVLVIDHDIDGATGPSILNDPGGQPTYQVLETLEVAPEAVDGWWTNYQTQQPLDRDAAMASVRALLAADPDDDLLPQLAAIIRRCTDLPNAA